MKTKTVSTRLEESELKSLDAMASRFGQDRASMTKSLLRRGLAELSFEQAVDSYREGKVTLSRAAEIAACSPWDFLAAMEAKGLTLHYGVADFQEDLDARF